MRRSTLVRWYFLYAAIQIFNIFIIMADSYTDNWGATYPQELRYNFSWTVHNFSAIDIHSFESPVFVQVVNSHEHRFAVKIYPLGQENQKDTMVVYLLWNCSEVHYMEFKYRLRVKNDTNDWIIVPASHRLFHNRNSGWGMPFQRSRLLNPNNNYIIDGALTIYVDVGFWEFFGSTYYAGAVKQSVCNKNDITALNALSSIGKLLNSNKHSDVTLVVNGQNFPAHMAILAAQSPVFEEMFENMKDNFDPPIAYIDGFNDQDFYKIMQYLYTGRIDNLEKHVNEIRQIAAYLQIQSLMKICDESLHKSHKFPNNNPNYDPNNLELPEICNRN